MSIKASGFQQIWIVCFGCRANGGRNSLPSFLVALELRSNQLIELSGALIAAQRHAPYASSKRSLFVVFEADHALRFHLLLGWPIPERILDLWVEFRNVTNGQRLICGDGLPGAMAWFGLGAASIVTGDVSIDRARALARAIAQLINAMEPHLDMGLAMLRGRYMAAVARMQNAGIPLDQPALGALTENWERVSRTLPPNLRAIDFSALQLDENGRAYSGIRPFSSRTGRNQPSSKSFIFSWPAWAHHLIRPTPGKAIAHIDFCQQEFGIAAGLSGDIAMQMAYRSADPYLAFAEQARAIDKTGSILEHGQLRERYKICALGVMFGMGAEQLATKARLPFPEAKRLLETHRAAYPVFWRWTDATEQAALLNGEMQSVFGWRVAISSSTRAGFIRNFPMQANGAEMLRLACSMVTEAGIRICAPLHDAILIEMPIDQIESAAEEAQKLMTEASSIVLDGFELRSVAGIVRHPNRYADKRGTVAWSQVEACLSGVCRSGAEPTADRQPARQRGTSCLSANPRPIYSYVSNKEDE